MTSTAQPSGGDAANSAEPGGVRPPAQHPWRLAVLLGALAALGPLSIDMYLPALPQIARDFSTSEAGAQATLGAYFIGLAVFQLVWGPVSDIIGRKRSVQLGLGLYFAGTLVCAWAPTLPWLVAARLVAAAGGAAGPVIGRALVRDLFAGAQMAQMFSMQMLMTGLAPVLAPSLGTLMLKWWGWRAIFGVLAAFAVLLAVVVARRIPGGRPARRQQRLLGEVREVMADRQFLTAAVVCACAWAAMFSYIAAAPFLFMERHGLSSQDFALLFAFNAAGLIATSQVNAWWLRRREPLQILRWTVPGFVVCAAALAVAAVADAPVWQLEGAIFLTVSLIGAVASNAGAVAMAHHRARAGVASSLLGAWSYGMSALLALGVAALPLSPGMGLGAMVAVSALVVTALLWAAAPHWRPEPVES